MRVCLIYPKIDSIIVISNSLNLTLPVAIFFAVSLPSLLLCLYMDPMYMFLRIGFNESVCVISRLITADSSGMYV